MQLSECVERLPELSARFEYFKAWWVPHTGSVHLFCIDGAPVPPVSSFVRSAPGSGLPPGRGALDDLVEIGRAAGAASSALLHDSTPVSARASYLGSRQGGQVMEGLLALAAEHPQATPLVNCALRPLLYPTLEARDLSYLVQSNEHRGQSESVGVRFQVSEFALPASSAAAALTELVHALRTHNLFLSFPVDIRFSRADDVWLSPAYERDTVWIGIPAKRPFDRETPHEAEFAHFEGIMLRHGGRPHWAKEHSVHAPLLRAMYPRWDAFLEARQRLDPHGVFLNEYLRELLGVRSGGPEPRSRL